MAEQEKKAKRTENNPFGIDKSNFDISKHLIDIENEKGETNKYLPVISRILWFKTNNPKAVINTELISANNGVVCFKASIYDEEEKLISIGHGSESTRSDMFSSAVAYEKAETRAVGRALRFLGYGASSPESGDESQPIDQAPVEGGIISKGTPTGIENEYRELLKKEYPYKKPLGYQGKSTLDLIVASAKNQAINKELFGEGGILELVLANPQDKRYEYGKRLSEMINPNSKNYQIFCEVIGEMTQESQENQI